MRLLLKQQGYANGYVTIDASDWYVDQRMIDSLKVNPKIDLTPFCKYYIAHIINRARYYDSLATVVHITGKSSKQVVHTLLLHHTLLNALFLDDLIKALESARFEFVNASEAYATNKIDEVPNMLPAGESIIYALTKERSPSTPLRYPGEDEEYESGPMTEYLNKYNGNKSH